jgi:acyl carrier protein
MPNAKIDNAAIRHVMTSLGLTLDIAALKANVPLNQQGMDSLDFVSLMFNLEQTYDIKITDSEVDRTQTIDAIVGLVSEKLATKA